MVPSHRKMEHKKSASYAEHCNRGLGPAAWTTGGLRQASDKSGPTTVRADSSQRLHLATESAVCSMTLS